MSPKLIKNNLGPNSPPSSSPICRFSPPPLHSRLSLCSLSNLALSFSFSHGAAPPSPFKLPARHRRRPPQPPLSLSQERCSATAFFSRFSGKARGYRRSTIPSPSGLTPLSSRATRSAAPCCFSLNSGRTAAASPTAAAAFVTSGGNSGGATPPRLSTLYFQQPTPPLLYSGYIATEMAATTPPFSHLLPTATTRCRRRHNTLASFFRQNGSS